MEHLEKIAKILNHPNVYAFLHIPVQAGSNQVLDKMNREYKIEDFSYVCGKYNKIIKNKLKTKKENIIHLNINF